MKGINGQYYMGWLPDLPDFRDYTVSSDVVKKILKTSGILKAGSSTLPGRSTLENGAHPSRTRGN